jgi:kynureninase
LDSVAAGAKAEQLLQDKTIQDTFMGAFHLTSDDFAAGSGTGYFNTTHGQLAFVFAKKKLTRFVYYFDPGVKGWQNPASWVKP